MNKRIQELAIEAAGRGFQTFATSDFDSPAKIERFAELIVRECITVITQNDYHGEWLGEKLKEHFSVDQ